MWWRKKRRPAIERPVVEALEPRILYAADLGAGLMVAATNVVPDAMEVRVLDAGGDYAAAAAGQDSVTVAAAPPGVAGAGAAAHASLPLNFETNAGQADTSIDFIARGNGVGIALADGNATLILKDGDRSDVLRMTLAGAATDASAHAEGAVTARSNYLVGSQDQWLTDVASHAAVRFDGVYNGIDVRYYGNERALEYDFIVAAGADWRAITLEFEGVDHIGIDADGALRLTVDGINGPRSLHFAAPVSYQAGADGREAVTSGYVIGDDGRVRFDIGAYDASRTLVIDPLLVYGSYLGGTGLDRARSIAADAAGNIYITGETASAAFPTSAGVFDTSQNGGSDVFVTKLNAAGTAVVYSTFVGGSGNDVAWGIALDAAGNAYVTGSTTSTNLPTVNAFQGARSGTQDAFFFKLNAAGTALSYSTYLGGTGSADIAYAIALDAAGNAYVSGDTDSSRGIASAGAYDTTLGGAVDAFLVKFDATQNGAASRVFGTYLGGSSGGGDDHGLAVAVDAAGKAYVSGYTTTTNFPTTASAYDSTSNGGDDAFLAVFDTAGSVLTYATYLGGAGNDSASGIALDAANMVYLSGSAGSGFPSRNAFDATFGGGASDAIVAKIDPAISGSASLIYSTYLGGAGDETAQSIAVDSLGRAHVTGRTSGSMPTTADALQATYAGGTNDAFYATLGSLGNSLVYSTYLGGSGDDAGYAVARDGAENIFITGFTASANLQQITGGGYDTTQNGGYDAFVVKFTNQTLTVTTTNDVVDGATNSIAALLANTGADGLISLREAIIATNNTAGADAIALPAGTYLITRAGSSEDVAATGDLDIIDALTITGAGSALTIVDGNALDRVFHVQAGASSSLTDLTIRGGVLAANLWGGGVLLDSGASLTLARAIITANSTGSGAGLYSYGTLTAIDTTFSNNAGAGWGGGIYNDGGVLTLDRVTVSGNTVAKDGGGIYNVGSGASLSLANVTVSGNTTTGIGGGIYTNRAITITNSTIAFNSSSGGADGIYAQGAASATLKNTLLYNPAGTNSNTALTSAGNNLDSDGSAGLAAAGDLSGTAGTSIDPKLSPLQDNGGSTRTLALLTGSTAINAGTATGAPATDQRGFARIGAPDIGAFEAGSITLSASSVAENSANGTAIGVASINPSDVAADGRFLNAGTPAFFTTYSLGQTLGGWTVTQASVDLLGSNFDRSPLGGNSIDLAGGLPGFGGPAGAISQSLATVVGQQYQVMFELSGAWFFDSNVKNLRVTFGGTSQDIAISKPVGWNSATDMKWAPQALTFTAVSGSTVLLLASLDGNGAGPIVADVRVAAAPASYTYSLIDNAGGRFAINSTTGLVSVANGVLLDYETAASHAITVRASSGATLFDEIFKLRVSDVNDAPVNTVPGAQSTAEDSARVFSTANGNRISITDIDAGAANNEVTLSVTNGSLTLAGTAGLTFSAGDGTADASMTLRGTQAAINTALDGLSYMPAANYNGGATLTLATRDAALLSLNLDTSLLGRYTFENSGALGTDTSPAAGYAGTASGATALNDATRGNVLGLAGAGYVQTTGHYGNPANVTLAAWVNLTSADTNGAEVISLGDSVVLRLDQPNGTVIGNFFDGSGFIVTAFSGTLAGTGWHHVAYTVNDASNAATLYLDGVAASTTNTTGSVSYTLGANSFIGKHGNGLTTRDFNGRIDDACIYNRALGAGEIAALAADLSLTDTDTVAITVTTVNDAPVLAAANNLNAINEDVSAGANNGTLVSALIAGQVTDPDSVPASGIAVTAVSNTNGTWEYTTNSGGVWNAFGAPTASAARLLAANAASSVRFVPNANWNGSVPGGITFRAWDQTGGSAGATANTSSNGGSTAYSSATASASITVNAVNDAPAGSNNSVTTNEDTGYVFVAADFGLTDPNDTPANAFDAVRISTLPGAGTLTNNGAAVSSGQVITVADINLGRLLFTPGLNASGSGYASFTFQVRDDGGNANGGIDLDASANTMTVNVSAVNDAPAGSNTSVTASEDTAYTFTAANFGFSDATDSPANALLAVRISTLPGAGALTNNGVALSAGQSVTAADIALGRLVFTPGLNANGTGYTTFTFQVQDDGGTANGGIDLDASPNTLTINVTAVNDAPVLTAANNLNPINEDVASGANTGTLVSALIAGQVTEPDSAPASGIAVTAASNSNGTWEYTTNSGGAWNAFGAPTASAARLLAANAATSVRFVPNANWNGTLAGGLSFRAWDQTSGSAGATANTGTNGGGSAFSSTIASAGITVNAVNDAPAGTNQTVTTNEDTAYTFAATDFGLTDPNDTPANAFDAVRISTLPGAGTLTNNGAAVSVNQVITVADINLNRLRFTPGLNASGSAYVSFTFRVRDDGGTANGGVNLDASPNTMTVNVTAIDDAPVNNVPAAQVTAYNTPLVFSTANGNRISVADVDAGGASVQIALSATNGTLALAGVAGLTFTAGANASASMTFTGSLTSINNALAALSFTPTTNFSGAATITVASDDLGNSGVGGPAVDTASIAVTINPSTALVIVGDGFGASEDVILNAASVLANDSDPALGLLTVSAVNGNGAAVNGTITLASGALLSIRTDGSFTYDPNGAFESLAQGATTIDSFSYTASSSAGGSAAGTVQITITGANDAPLLAGANNLNAIDEDITGDSGTLVSALIAGLVTDADDGAAAGIAVNTAINSNGSWQYSTDGGGLWTPFGTPTNTNARLLAADAGTAVRFVPNADWNGTLAGGLRFQAWDRSSGVAGATADASINGGDSAFSITNFAAGITVDAVNDAPAASDGAITMLEDTTYALRVVDFGLSDASDSPANALAAVQITTLPGSGTLTSNGAGIIAGQFVSAADIMANRLVFTPAANANGAAYASFTFRVQDDGGVANGGVDLETGTHTLTINVTAVNDAPRGSSTTVSTAEDSAYTLGLTDFGFGDADDTPANAFVSVRISTLPGAGSLTNNGVAVGGGQTITAADIALGRLVFTPAADANGADYTSFTFQIQDDGGVANGGVDLDAAPDTLTVDLSAVNDAPVLTGAGDLVPVNEDQTTINGTLVSALIAAHVSDADGTPVAGIAVTAVDNSNGSWQYTTDNGALWSAFGSPGTTNARLLAADAGTSVRFVPNANWNGSVAGGIVFRAWDQSSGSAGGTADTSSSGGTSAFSNATAAAGITVNSVNDAPSGTSNSLSTNEDTAFIFSAAHFGFSDPNELVANGLAALRISTLPGAGTLTNNGASVSIGQTITVADINLGRLRFTPDANSNGAAYATFTFQAQDNGGVANGGVDLDASPDTITVNVSPVNDAPAGASTTVTTNEDTAYTFSAANFGFSDGADGPANGLLAVRIGTLPGAGTLTNNGVALSAGQSVTAADISLGRLRFTPGANANGSAYASFTFQVQDDGGTINGGQDLDATPDTLTIDVAAINDAPAGGDRTIALLEDAAYTFAAADFSFVDAADSPANGWLAVRIGALPAAGILTLNGTPVVGGQVVSATDIAAGRLVFTPAADGNGLAYAGFVFQIQDDGGTSGGGVDLDASPNSISFDVIAINDAPSATDRNISVATGGMHVFDVADFGASDARDLPADSLAAVTIDSLPATGALSLAGTAVSAGQTISAADIVAARLVFTPANTGTVVFSFRVQDTGGTANGGVDSEATAHAMRILVAAPVAPAITASALIADGTPPATSAVSPVPAVVAPVPVATAQAAIPSPARTVATTTAATTTDDAAGAASGSSGLADSLPPGAAARGVPGIEAAATAPIELRALGTLSGERKGFSFESVTLVDAILASGSRSEVSRTGFDQFLTSLRAQGFIDELDRVRDDAKQDFDLDKSFAVTATGVSFGLSVAYVLWLVRSGVLMGSLLSSLPAWRVLDPLPVLAREGDADEDEADDELPDPVRGQTNQALQTLRGY